MTTELGFKIAGPAVDAADVDRLCEWLAGAGWVTSRILTARSGGNDRYLRACAEASDGRILSGQNGYRLFDVSTPLEEADRAASWLESQARKMLARAGKIRGRYHRYSREGVA